jgi:hypothetical protein
LESQIIKKYLGHGCYICDKVLVIENVNKEERLPFEFDELQSNIINIQRSVDGKNNFYLFLLLDFCTKLVVSICNNCHQIGDFLNRSCLRH